MAVIQNTRGFEFNEDPVWIPLRKSLLRKVLKKVTFYILFHLHFPNSKMPIKDDTAYLLHTVPFENPSKEKFWQKKQ